MNVLGIDLGTSRAKAMVCAPDGTVLGRGAAGYDISTPRDGWAGAVAQVAAIAVSGQMHGVVLVSEQSVVLRPAILWLDRRATAEAGD